MTAKDCSDRGHWPCAICGMDDGPEHDSQPHCYEPALGQCCRDVLTEARARIEARLTALAGEQVQGRDWILIAMGRALFVVDELLEGD